MLKKSKKDKRLRVASQTFRAAIFSLAYEPFFGGAEVAVKEITKRIPEGKFVCFTHRFDRRWSSYEEIGNMAIARLGLGVEKPRNYYSGFWAKAVYVWRAYNAAKAAHKRAPFDFIWAIMASYGGLAALLFKMRHPKVPMLLTLQEGDSESHILKRVGIFYPLWKRIFRRADYVQTISDYLKDFAERHGVRARTPVEVVPNGVNVAEVEAAIQENKKIKKQKTKKIREVFKIISTSRLVPKNGLDTLIYAAAELKKKKAPDFAMRIVGEGPERGRLEALIRHLGLLEEVDLAGEVAPEDVARELVSADIFVRPSRSEGLGNSFLEAMAAGLPIIGTKVGGIPDFLRDPNIYGVTKANGLFAIPNRPADLAAKIMLLMKNKSLRTKMSANGQKLVRDNYGWEEIAKRMRGIFEKLRT